MQLTPRFLPVGSIVEYNIGTLEEPLNIYQQHLMQLICNGLMATPLILTLEQTHRPHRDID